MSNLPVIDYVFIGLVLLMVVHGFFKGFIEELFSWAAIVLAVWLAVLLNGAGAVFIRERFMPDIRVVPELLAFIAIFLIVLAVIKILEKILKDVIAGANLGGLNKFLGAIFGLVEGFALTALVIFVFSVQPLFDASGILGGSLFAQILLPIIKIPLGKDNEVVDVVLSILPNFPA